MNYNSTANQGYGIPVGGHRNQPVDKEPVTAALVAIVILGTGLVLILLCCYICVLRRLCCPDWGRKGTHHPRSTTTQQTSCDITKFDTLTAERHQQQHTDWSSSKDKVQSATSFMILRFLSFGGIALRGTLNNPIHEDIFLWPGYLYDRKRLNIPYDQQHPYLLCTHITTRALPAIAQQQQVAWIQYILDNVV
ncbi:hypothetical protein Fcan01_12316 [Folsomia candida]|uniref:Uncharacterized protein n=1 Tax=Folsomia candida TaxID=158441 RepID=A0A226E7H2_FOLCA|nr:hypothetical protein Fcan01_12316 [Folsomia candida]